METRALASGRRVQSVVPRCSARQARLARASGSQLVPPLVGVSAPVRYRSSRRSSVHQAGLARARHVPEHLVDDVVGVRIDRAHGDVALGLSSTKCVRSQQDHVAGFDGLLSELTKQNRRTVADNDHSHAVVRVWTGGPVNGQRASENRRKECGARPITRRARPGHEADPDGAERTNGEAASERKGGPPTRSSAFGVSPQADPLRTPCGHVWFAITGSDAALRTHMTTSGRLRSAGRVR